MKMSSKIAIAALCAAAAAAAPATAQNVNGRPNYGEVTLRSGFTPDPYVVNVQAGGNLDAARQVDSSCRGSITNAPDYRLSFDAGNLPLIISVASSADTTLVINAPNGRFYCDDDGGDGLNPSIRFDAPQSGRYEIWVGTFSPGSTQPAQLTISELGSR